MWFECEPTRRAPLKVAFKPEARILSAHTSVTVYTMPITIVYVGSAPTIHTNIYVRTTTWIRRYHRSSSPSRLDLACLSLFLRDVCAGGWRSIVAEDFSWKMNTRQRKTILSKTIFPIFEKTVEYASQKLILFRMTKISSWQKCYARSKQEISSVSCLKYLHTRFIYSYILPTKYSTETWNGCVVSASPYGGHSC